MLDNKGANHGGLKALLEIPNFKIILMMSAAIFVLLFSFYSAVNVYSKLLKENGHENLGF
jgi:hypothetical protein